MANTSTQTRELKGVLKFSDDDSRIVTVPMPKANLSASDAASVRSAFESFGAISVGDKTGAAFQSVTTAYIDEANVTTLDLNQ